jgi:hypothetical protein
VGARFWYALLVSSVWVARRSCGQTLDNEARGERSMDTATQIQLSISVVYIMGASFVLGALVAIAGMAFLDYRRNKEADRNSKG